MDKSEKLIEGMYVSIRPICFGKGNNGGYYYDNSSSYEGKTAEFRGYGTYCYSRNSRTVFLKILGDNSIHWFLESEVCRSDIAKSSSNSIKGWSQDDLAYSGYHPLSHGRDVITSNRYSDYPFESPEPKINKPILGENSGLDFSTIGKNKSIQLNFNN